MQWRIQDFPEGGREPIQGEREHFKFVPIYLHEIERLMDARGAHAVPHAPP